MGKYIRVGAQRVVRSQAGCAEKSRGFSLEPMRNMFLACFIVFSGTERVKNFETPGHGPLHTQDGADTIRPTHYSPPAAVSPNLVAIRTSECKVR